MSQCANKHDDYVEGRGRKCRREPVSIQVLNLQIHRNDIMAREDCKKFPVSSSHARDSFFLFFLFLRFLSNRVSSRVAITSNFYRFYQRFLSFFDDSTGKEDYIIEDLYSFIEKLMVEKLRASESLAVQNSCCKSLFYRDDFENLNQYWSVVRASGWWNRKYLLERHICYYWDVKWSTYPSLRKLHFQIKKH